MDKIAYTQEQLAEVLNLYAEARHTAFAVEEGREYDNAKETLDKRLPQLRQMIPQEMHSWVRLDSIESRIRKALEGIVLV